MAGRAVVVLAALLVVPLGAASDHEDEGTTFTGDEDRHPDPPDFGCGDAPTRWNFTLELVEPAPNDMVLLRYGLRGNRLATHDEPVVTARVSNSTTCRPPVMVYGVLVEGVLSYRTTWDFLGFGFEPLLPPLPP